MSKMGAGHGLVHLPALGRGEEHTQMSVLFCLLEVPASLVLCVPLWVYSSVCRLEGRELMVMKCLPSGSHSAQSFTYVFS